jgi:transcriptional regulator with XRE-family HTH domain
MDIGTTLRNARERRGLSIEELAATTRITLPVLRALEHNAFDTMPSGIFVRGFIRSYAREVGLDPEEMVAQFLEQTGDAPVTAEQPAEPRFDDDILIDPEPSSGRATWGYALIVAALLVAFVSSTRTDEGDDALTPVAAAEELSGEDAGDAGDVAAEPRAVATTGDGLLRFDIIPSGPCWVEAVVDGKTVVYRLMQAGERQTLSAREIALRVGDPAACAYNINGMPGRPLGTAGTPVSVTLTADSYRDFLN